MTEEDDSTIKIKTQSEFSEEIIKIVDDTDLNYIEAIVQYCEDHGIEIESAAKLVNKDLKSKLKQNANTLNCLK